MPKVLNILVVDDDVENALSIADLFAADNHQVRVAHDGQQAVEAYAAQNFDVGFFDVMMPVKNGVESFLEIKSRFPDAKVYFMTGYSEHAMLEKALSGGALGVFSKPTDPMKLIDIVERQAA